ncbi:MAG: hypothetical protein HYV09_36090 [Deltaproteobacteria bacterium]|nr:hypothetical protein [Deltaproteobacteria bacterium]
MRRFPRLPCALAVIVTVACGADGDRERDQFRLTSPGTGAASSGELVPTWPGTRRHFAAGATSAIGYRELGGRTVVRFATSDDFRFFRASDAGFFYDGNARAGQFAHSLLLLPKTVRDGTKWQVLGTQGDALAELEVSARGEQETLFGKLPVWHVVQRNLVTKRAFETDYAEGRGPVYADALLAAAVVPLEARLPRKNRARIALNAIGDGQPIARQFWAKRVSMIHPPSGPATLRVDGLYTWFSKTAPTRRSPTRATSAATRGTSAAGATAWPAARSTARAAPRTRCSAAIRAARSAVGR